MENPEIAEMIKIFGGLISSVLGVLALVLRVHFKKIDKINHFINTEMAVFRERQSVQGKFAEEQKRINEKLDNRLDNIEKDLAIIKSNTK